MSVVLGPVYVIVPELLVRLPNPPASTIAKAPWASVSV